MAWTAPRTWVAAEVVTAALLNTHLRDNLKALGDAWTSYVPAWTALTTDPVIGNGTITGASRLGGQSLSVRITVTMGSTTTYGSGVYRLSLPVGLKNGSHLTAIAFDTSASVSYPGVARISSTSATGDNMRIVFGQGTAGATSAVPFTWATGDVLQLNGKAEVA